MASPAFLDDVVAAFRAVPNGRQGMILGRFCSLGDRRLRYLDAAHILLQLRGDDAGDIDNEVRNLKQRIMNFVKELLESRSEPQQIGPDFSLPLFAQVLITFCQQPFSVSDLELVLLHLGYAGAAAVLPVLPPPVPVIEAPAAAAAAAAAVDVHGGVEVDASRLSSTSGVLGIVQYDPTSHAHFAQLSKTEVSSHSQVSRYVTVIWEKLK